jgi:nucleoside-diphosphate-sugar epimerase
MRADAESANVAAVSTGAVQGGSGQGLAGARVLVTGGFGFLGGHVLEILLREGASVHVVDNLSTNPVAPEVLLEELGSPEQLTYDVTTVDTYLRSAPPRADYVLHLASIVGPAGVLSHSGRIVASIVTDTYLLADYALEHGSRLLDVSTSEVYGGGRDGLCAEGDPKIVPAETSARLEYAIGKLAAETALINLHHSQALDAVIVRPFNIAGPRQSGEGGFVLPRFLAQARLGLPLTIFGDGSARRAFSHVRDLADGIVLAAQRGRPGTAYNLGNHRNTITIDALADQVLEITGSSSVKEYVDPRTIYGPSFVEANDKFPEAGRAITELGWEPTGGVGDVVRDSWSYMAGASPETFARLAGRKLIEQLVSAQAGIPQRR